MTEMKLELAVVVNLNEVEVAKFEVDEKARRRKGQRGSGAWGEDVRAVGAPRIRGRPVRAGRRGGVSAGGAW